MIVLPERGAPRGKLLLPMRPQEWRHPSQRATIFGIENQTRFRVTARLSDGWIAWRGWFDDREDADAFLYALATGSLLYERELWRLPTPWWDPDFADLSYDFATVTFLTSPTGSNQTYTVPGDWNSSNSSVETIGAGGGGGTCTGSGPGTGAGGGAYSKQTNIVLTPGGTATYQIASAGGVNPSSAGGDSWFNGTTLGGSSVGSKGGQGGTDNAGTGAGGGSGGAAGSGVGATKNSGGNGGSDGASASSGGGGGGGAASSLGNGGNGGNAAAGVTNSPGGGGGGGGGGSAGSDGSAVDGGAGGAGGNNDLSHGAGSAGSSGGGTGGNGSNPDGVGHSGGGGGGGGGNTGGAGGAGGAGNVGQEWDASHGSGSGGGGGARGTTTSGAGGTGAGFGGGGGGAAFRVATFLGGSAGNGVIVITYVPTLPYFPIPQLGPVQAQ